MRLAIFAGRFFVAKDTLPIYRYTYSMGKSEGTINIQMNPEILNSLKTALKADAIQARPLEGGTNGRTFLVEADGKEYVFRTEGRGGFQLKRAYNAQMLAKNAGVKTAEVVAHDFGTEGKDFWVLEKKCEGQHFIPDEMEEGEAKVACIDLGKQFRLMHEIELDRFSLLPPYPYLSYQEWEEKNPEEVKESENLTGPVQKTFSEWKERTKNKAAKAFRIASIDSQLLEQILELIESLNYQGTPRFCGGDTRTSNILVEKGKIQAIIDWEWAHGGDPASHIGAWSAWNENPRFLDYFLEGYEPEDLESMRKNVLKYEVVDTISTILSYSDMNDQKGMDAAKNKLEKLLKEKSWE